MLSLMDIASARIRAEPNGSRVREGFAEKKEFKVANRTDRGFAKVSLRKRSLRLVANCYSSKFPKEKQGARTWRARFSLKS